MGYTDITKTGARNFAELQLENDENFQRDLADRAQEITSLYNSFARSKEFDPFENAPQKVRSSLYGTSTSWGESMFDEKVANANEFEQLADVRANNQPWIAKLGAGLGKGVALAGTTFLDGTVGLIVGGVEAIAQKDISKLWDNEISNGLQEFNRSMEEWLPNYRTEEEQNNAWYENLGTINFWADSFLKNMGFTVGALYSGGVYTKGLKLLGKLSQLAGKGMQAVNVTNKATKAISAVGKNTRALGIAMQTNGVGAKLTGALFSAVNEGRIEANHTVYDLRDLQVQQAYDAAAKRSKEIAEDPTLTDEERIALQDELNRNYEITLAQIDENLKKAGLTDFLLNIPILAVNNFWTFGRMYSQGFRNARNVAGKNVKKSVHQAANEAAAAAENTIAKNTVKQAGRYAWENITKKKSLGKGLLTALREGNEEMAQAWASEFGGYQAFYSDGPDTYYRAMSDPKALQETMSSWEAASKAFANTYGNGDRYEEFAVGFLTGLLGTPTFGRRQNSSANTWAGEGKMMGISGGILGEFKYNAEMNRKGYEHVTTMNAALDKREQIDKTARIHAAMSQFNDAMNGFAEANDKFEYQNASDNLDWMGITSFISTGREEDLKTLLEQDFDNISDEELETIAAFTAQNDGSNTGGFREKGSNKLITADSPQTDKDEMRQKLNKAKEKMLDEIDSYKTSVDIIRNYASDTPNVTEAKINELAWMHWKINRFDRRASEIKKDNAEQFTLIAQALVAFREQQQEVLNRKEESTEGLSASNMSVTENKNAQLSIAKQNAQRKLIYTTVLLGIINDVASNDSSIMASLAPMLQTDKGFLDSVLKSDNFYDLAVNQGLSKPEFDKAIRDIRDLGRLAEANKTFNDKLKEYMENPLKQEKDHDKADMENNAVAQEVDRETTRKRAKKVTRQQILNGEVDADDVINNTKTSDIERQMAQDAKVTTQIGQRVEAMIAKQTQEGTLSNEDAARIESAIQQGIAQSKSINDLTGSNAAFMVDSNGQPLSDEQIALIQDLMSKAAKEVAESNGLNIKDGEIDFGTIEEIDKSRTGPTDSQIEAAEKALAKDQGKTTGNDAVEKAITINNGVQGDPEQVLKKGRPNRGSSKSQQKRGNKKNVSNKRLKEFKKEKEAVTKAAKDKAKQEAITQKKNSIVSAALMFGINSNAINISTPEGQQETQLLSDILSKAYDLINEGKIEKLSGIMQVLQSMDEYEKLQQMLNRNPNLGAALKSISDNLSKEFTVEEDSTDNAAELEKTIGPETSIDITAAPASFSSENLNPVISIPNYFAPATSQYYRDPKTGQILPVPFTSKVYIDNKARKKKLEETYNYLIKNNAFKNASEVKAGDDIYFTIHPNLNTAAGGVVILMSTDPEGKHIVGDLADTESYTYDNNTLLKSMIERITKEFNERTDKDSSEPFVSKETSSVRQSMVGHVMFTNSKSITGDKTINGVFGNGNFKMGVVNRAGSIITTNQGDESVSGDLNVITPKTRFTPGTPVVLIPSGKGTNKYVAVPFQMARYTSSMKGSKFHKYAESVLKRVLLNKEGEPIDLTSNKNQVMVKNALNALFNGDFHVNFTNGQLVIHQTIKTVKEGVVEKKNDILFRKTPNASIVNNILSALQSKGMIIRIDRREINKDSNLKDLDFTYNDMMGDLAHTNLSEKSSTTVNDWFIVNPVNEKGEEINISRVEYRDTRTEKTPAQRNDTKITYNGKEYLVSEEDVVVDKDGNPRTDLNVTEQQIIIAKAEIEKNDLAAPIGTEGEQVFWYSLGNGNLFYNKEGQERVVVSETDKQAVKDSLTKKVEVSKGPTKAELNKNEPTTIDTRIIIDSSLGGNGMSQVFGYDPSKASTKDTNAYLFWRTRASEPRSLRNPATGNDRENFYIERTNGTSVITYFSNKHRKVLNRHDGMGITIWRKLTPEEVKAIQDYLWEGSFKTYDEVAKFVDNVMHNEPSTQSPSGQETKASKEESVENKYPAGFNNQAQKDFFDAMSKDRQKQLLEANPNAILDILPYINDVMHDYGIDDLEEAEADIDDIFDRLSNTRYRAVEEVKEYTPADIESEKEWIKKALPQLSDEDHLRIVEGLIKIAGKDNPRYAYGKTQQGIMTISDAAASGTVYHEAFHAVIDVLLNENEIEKLFNKGAKKYGIERDSLENELAIEESLAEDFRRYVQRERAYQRDLEQSSGISKLFKVLKHTAKIWLDHTSYINNMFYRINKGQLANRSLLPANRNTEHTRKMWGQDDARKIYFNEVYNKNLTDFDIVRINRKLKNLSDRIGDATWHLQQSKKGGYYIAGYNNRPVLTDDYWSPMLAKYSQFTEEEQEILKNAPRNAKGQLLVYPNGPISNLNEKQYAQVRTKAFKEWFGDWENPFSRITGFSIIFGHPAIGKTTALQGNYKDKFIDWDVEYNEKRDRWIEEHTKTKKGTKEFKNARNKYLIYPENYPDYIEFLTEEWNRIKNKARQENKILLVSPHTLLKLFPNDFNYIINVESNDFINRNINRGGNETNSKLWKEGIDKTISNINNIPKYTIERGIYLSDLLDNANNTSKVVDENGEPLVVYRAGEINDDGTIRSRYKAYYFTPSKDYAEQYAKQEDVPVHSFFLKANSINDIGNGLKPIIRSDNETVAKRGLFEMPWSREDVNIILEGKEATYSSGEYLIPNLNQIKSAEENIGTFSPESNNVRYRESDITPEDIIRYHQERLDYANLDEAQKALLEDRGITEEQYSFLTQAEKENLRMCLI